MNTKLLQTANTKIDPVLWLLVSALLITGIVAHSYLSSVAGPYKMIGWMLLLSVTVLIAAQTALGGEIVEFAKLARGELLKVVWPTQQETLQTTFIIIIAVMIVGLLLWGADTILIRIIGMLTGQRG